jgi:hypothetical protein
MHQRTSRPNPSRSRRRSALEVLAVVAGTYGAYQMVQHLRAVQRRSAGDVSLPPLGNVMSRTASSGLGEHSEWLESFRTEQVRRLRSDPPAA